MQVANIEQKAVPLKWFAFHQNNSGGYFTVDANVSEYVFVQAADADSAIAVAERFCDNSDSCECCGDRWSLSWTEAADQPEVYGKHYTQHGSGWVDSWARLHYFDGRVEAYPEKPIAIADESKA